MVVALRDERIILCMSCSCAYYRCSVCVERRTVPYACVFVIERHCAFGLIRDSAYTCECAYVCTADLVCVGIGAYVCDGEYLRDGVKCQGWAVSAVGVWITVCDSHSDSDGDCGIDSDSPTLQARCRPRIITPPPPSRLYVILTHLALYATCLTISANFWYCYSKTKI